MVEASYKMYGSIIKLKIILQFKKLRMKETSVSKGGKMLREKKKDKWKKVRVTWEKKYENDGLADTTHRAIMSVLLYIQKMRHFNYVHYLHTP